MIKALSRWLFIATHQKELALVKTTAQMPFNGTFIRGVRMGCVRALEMLDLLRKG